jgi:hypothetical protein
MAYIGLIASVVGTGIKLAAGSGGPSYPNAPQIRGININNAMGFMDSYEREREQAGYDAWKAKYPLLNQGEQYAIGDIAKNQAGYLSGTTSQSIANTGLEAPKQGNVEDLSHQLGLSPVTLAQRNSLATTRQIAQNPQWTSKVSGGTLASMLANNNKNQNAFSQFLGAQNTANFVTQQTQNAYNTQALVGGLLGTAQIGARLYQNQQYGALSPWGQGNATYGSSSSGYPTGNAVSNSNLFQSVPNNYVSSNPSYNPYGQPPSQPSNFYNNINSMPFGLLGNQPMDNTGDISLWTGGGTGMGNY